MLGHARSEHGHVARELERHLIEVALDAALPATPEDGDRVMELAGRWNIAGALRRLVDAVSA